MNEKWDITVMLGGPSAEREVSLKSGRAVANALRSIGHRVSELDPIPRSWHLPKKVDVIFLALHGTYGEDGNVQSELEERGIAYTGCKSASSALAFDKVKSKNAFLQNDILTPSFAVCDDRDFNNFKIPKRLIPPLIMKPACQGSSVGIEIIQDLDSRDWKGQLQKVLGFGRQAVIEEFIKGREIAVGIIGDDQLPIIEVIPKNGFYNYENKYTEGATDYICPASFSSTQRRQIGKVARSAFEAIGGGDYARVDMIVRGSECFVLEINTLPGMTPLSLFPKAAAVKGECFPQLCNRLVKMAKMRNATSNSQTSKCNSQRSYNSYNSYNSHNSEDSERSHNSMILQSSKCNSETSQTSNNSNNSNNLEDSENSQTSKIRFSTKINSILSCK